MSADLASYGGGLGFEPPLSPPAAASNQSSPVTNMHGYLGLVPGADEEEAPVVGFAPPAALPAEPTPVPAPDQAAAAAAALEALLLRFGLVSSDQLGEALREQAETGRPVGAIVVERGWVSAADIERLTGNQVAVAPAPAPAPAPPAVPVSVPAPAPAVEAPAPFPAPALELEDPPAPVIHVVEPQPEPEPFLALGSVEPEPAVEALPEPAPEPAPVAPIVPFQGTFTPMDDPEPVAEVVPELEPVPAPVVPFEPPVAPERVVSAPPVAPEPVAVIKPFVSEPEPTPPAVPLATPEQPNVKHVVIARLTTGERVEVNSYADRNAARAEAKALMAYLREGHPDWPFVHGRFIRPEAIVSIDLETVLLT